MAFGLADLRRLRRAMDAVGRFVQGDPYRTDWAVRAWRNGEYLVVLALLEIDVGVVGVVRIERDARHRVNAGGRRRVGRADGRRIGCDQLAARIVGVDFFLGLVGYD